MLTLIAVQHAAMQPLRMALRHRVSTELSCDVAIGNRLKLLTYDECMEIRGPHFAFSYIKADKEFRVFIMNTHVAMCMPDDGSSVCTR